MNAVFSVGYNGKLDELKKIIESSNKVKTVMTGGVAGKIGGGRPQYVKSLDVLAKQIEYAHSKGVSFELALNAPCGLKDKSDKNWWNSIQKYIKALEKLDVDSVIVSHPFIIDLVKSYTKMKITVSTICEIMTVRSALYYEKLGADVITPSMNLNMNIKELKLMKKTLTKAILRIMLNEHCLGDCPWRRFHHNHYAHSNTEIDYHVNCKKMYLNNPYLLLTNNAIRPEDMHYYKDITNNFKIVSRLVFIDDILIRIKAYSEGKFKGNYVQLFDLKLSSVFYIPNEQLNGLIQKKWSCSKICNNCNYCQDLFSRIGKK